MGFLLRILALAAVCFAGIRCLAGEGAPPRAREGELRGVWIHSPGYFKDWDAEMKRLADAGLNAVFLNVCDAPFGHYPSKVLPATSGYYQKTGTDWVDAASKACRKHGLELHAWRVCFKGIRPGSDLAAQLEKEGRLMLRADGTPYHWERPTGSHAFCHTDPKTAELEAAAMVELATKYDIDGVHLDYIRYPQSDAACFCERCRRHFVEKSGLKDVRWPDDIRKGTKAYDEFIRMREGVITGIVRQVSEKVRAANPNVRISAAVFSAVSYALTVGQNWPDWVERGYVDFVCPMDYVGDVKTLSRLVRSQHDLVKGRVPLYPGFTPPKGTETVADFIDAVRRSGGDGFVVFQYTGPDCALARSLPLIAGSATRGGTYTNHTGPAIQFDLTVANGRLKGQVRCAPTAPGAGKVKSVELTPVLETPSGERKSVQATQTIIAEAVIPVDLPLAGSARLALYGTIQYEDGGTRKFAHRSLIFARPANAANPNE